MIRLDALVFPIIAHARRKRPPVTVKIAIRGQWTLLLGKDCVCRI